LQTRLIQGEQQATLAVVKYQGKLRLFLVAHPDRSLYKGSMEQQRKSGFGEYRWANQDVYCGYWKNDEMDGFGQYQYRRKARQRSQ